MNRRKIFVLILLIWTIRPGLSQTDSLHSYLDQALAFQSQRSSQKSVELLTFAIDKFVPSADNDSLKAQVYHALGISFYRQRNGRNAIKSWQEALAIRQQFLPFNHTDIIKTYINIANAHLMLNKYEDAAISLHQALDLLQSQVVKDQHNLSRVYESLGLVARLTEDFQSAQSYLLQSYLLKEVMYKNEPWQLINIVTRLFDVYKEIGNQDKMLEFAELSLAQSKLAPKDDDQYYFDLANAHNNLGIAYSASRQTAKAIEHFNRSININARFADRDEFRAFSYNNLILQYNLVGDKGKALLFCQKAKDIFSRESSSTIYLAETMIEEGDVYFAHEDFEKSLETYHEAIQLKVIDSKLESISENPGPENLILGNRTTLMDALFKKSTCLWHLKRWTEGASTADSLIKFVKQIRNQLSDRTAKKYLLETSKKFYEQAIDQQYALYLQSNKESHLEKAISLFNESKAAILYDALAQNALTTQDQTLKYLIEKERELYRSITEREQYIWEATVGLDLVSERDSIVLLRTEILKLRDSIAPVLSEHADKANLMDQSYTINAIRSQFLPEKGAIIQYFVGIENTYVIYVDQENYAFDLISSKSALSSMVEDFLKHLKNPSTIVQTYSESSHNLYKKIAEPYLISDNCDQLIIIPDDILTFVPWEALITDTLNNNSNYSELPYLLKDMAITYAASLFVLDLQRSRTIQSEVRDFLGMGSDYTNFAEQEFSKLVYAVEEVKQVAQIADGDQFSNELASKARFLDLHPKYRFLHLSLHAKVNPQEPSLSFLQFSGAGKNSGEEKLYSSEIYNQTYNAELIVLSACETGSGSLAKGEGILSLAHAFAYAGAKSTVMSLWQLSDRSTATIMTSFYEGLKNSLSQDHALQDAKLHYTQKIKAVELAHPFYWAAMIQYGDSRPIIFKASSGVWSYILLSLLVIIMGYWLFYRSKIL